MNTLYAVLLLLPNGTVEGFLQHDGSILVETSQDYCQHLALQMQTDPQLSFPASTHFVCVPITIRK